MKLYTYKRTAQSLPEVGVLRDGKLVPIAAFGLKYATMNELIRGASHEELKALASGAFDASTAVALESVKLLAPIPEPAQDVLCLGLNYMAHANEARSFNAALASKEGWPVYFSKRVNWAPGDGDGIPAHEDVTGQLDYEVELAVIIGRDAKNVTMEDAKDYVFGYTVLNDVTARDLQNRHVQWYFGKSLDGFCPMGPYIVTADEIGVEPALKIQSYVNGELRQDSNTANMIYKIPQIIEELSGAMTLQAGTIIALGTPSGVGMGFNPPKFLKSGDVVTCKIESIGEISNTIE